jgi:putative membrane protein
MLKPAWQKNDSKAKWLIGILSVVVFAAITVLGKYNLAGKDVLPFDAHIFASVSATMNAFVSLLLIAGLISVKKNHFVLHRNIMITAMILSIFFLISYIGHHLFAGESIFGDVDGNHILSDAERAAAGSTRGIYLAILITHIPLAGLALPFILFAAYRGLTGDYAKHKKLVRYVWPVWLYVAVTGVLVYVLIRPYYQ